MHSSSCFPILRIDCTGGSTFVYCSLLYMVFGNKLQLLFCFEIHNFFYFVNKMAGNL